MTDAVVVILSDEPVFDGQGKVLEKEGCCVCHPDSMLSKPFGEIKNGQIRKVVVLKRVTNEVLKRMLVTAKHKNIEIIEVADLEQLFLLF